MKIPDKIRYLNKKFTNRIMMKIAGRKGSPIVLIEHTGRCSGKIYRIPLMAARVKDGFMFALTYGTHVDWYKNVLHSQTAKMKVNGTCYSLASPQTVSIDAGQTAFGQPAAAILKLIGIQDFFFMTSTPIQGSGD
jgi:deazaflavin-dependent oxidoreductase (nitroreductase family)